LLFDVFLESTTQWLKPGDPAWRTGLIVTKWESDKLINPWSWPEKNTHYWLKEYRGLPGDPLARQLDRIDFYPGVMPWSLTGAAAIIALTLLATDTIAIVRWWPQHRARSIVLSTASLVAATWIFWPRTTAPPLTAQQKRDRDYVAHRDDKSLYTALSEQVFRTLYSDPPPDRKTI
jgi:hypothetical protein